MDEQNISLTYKKEKIVYDRAVDVTIGDLDFFLQEKNIPYLVVNGRVKELNSVIEKINRKNKLNYSDIEDICGVRVILYYENDIESLTKVIKKQYQVHHSEDKLESLDEKEFGYRSVHMIVSIKKDWCSIPRYKNLDGIKIEIQIRTVLMHAWAEIEHKLGYKNNEQVPTKIKRKFSLLSAKLEDADIQFQELKEQMQNYQEKTINESKKQL